MLVKLKASETDIRAEVKSCVEIFRGTIVDVTPTDLYRAAGGRQRKAGCLYRGGARDWHYGSGEKRYFRYLPRR